MIIYPAVDIKNGVCVRLTQGDYSKVTVFSNNPVEIALKWEGKGARWLHVIDLDGARVGHPVNMAVISDMAVNLGIPLQMGGGIRDIETMEIVLNKGVQRMILGTSAISNPSLVKEALRIFQENIAIGIDALDGMAKAEGWEKDSGISALELARKMEQLGAKTIIYTDISRDGMLEGPNLESIEAMTRAVDCPIIAAGGITSLADIRNLKQIGVAGVIIGKALYTGDIDFEAAVRAAEEVG
ncbi:MAG TPA: 1-(5-phosphoribosyl)-5-[(5-phosphoribosylamino)methylideneamino]imidazole-4-carboxamide isomerase [Clostridiales bacterium]|nr:1-(5-phosphoribosyl)-5-[(5-phosphoribosylamino)methylideneamino]imidazole-4-carboxamide isomerase [Clostridiales bacterium]